MKKEIREIIEKNLPKQMGEVLQERFRELEEKEKQLEQALTQLEKRNEHISNLEERITTLKKQVAFIEETKKLRKETEKRERELKITLLEEKLKAAEVIKNNTFQLASIVFKSVNPVYDISLWGSLPTVDNFGNITQQPMNANGAIQKREE